MFFFLWMKHWHEFSPSKPLLDLGKNAYKLCKIDDDRVVQRRGVLAKRMLPSSVWKLLTSSLK
jgi:hypothetical protein